MQHVSTRRSATPDPAPAGEEPIFDVLERTLSAAGPGAALGQLIEHLDRAGEYRALLDALLLSARHELGLPPIQVGTLASLPEPARSRFEERYVEAIRQVGGKLLAAGEIPTAWAYFRAISEPEPVVAALETYQPGQDAEKVGQVIDVAFHQGAHPRRGFELILDHYGTCSAITALEQAPPSDAATQEACVARLIRHLHGQLAANLRADITQRGGEAAAESTSIAELLAAAPGLLDDECYHIDISHLSSAVRYSIMVTDPAILELAIDLTEYGRRLSPRLQFEGAPPFEKTFDDHRIFLKALIGKDVDAAISHFRGKLQPAAGADLESTLPAQVLVNLLVRVGRIDEAIDVAAEHLAEVPDQALTCPSIAELCQRGGRLDRLAEIARKRGNPVHYLASRLPGPRVTGP